jgi:branched-chain amino acid transport system substrate-binding protein
LRAKDAKPDAVFAFVGGGPSSINIVKQFASSGLKQTMKLIGTADLISDELLPAEGPDSLDIVTASNYSADHNSKLNHDYVRIYKQVIANPQPADIPTFISVQAFDAMTMIDHSVGLQKGAIDAQKTIDLLRGYAFESPRGPIRIDAQTREVHESMYIRKTELVNGTYVNAEVAAFPP